MRSATRCFNLVLVLLVVFASGGAMGADAPKKSKKKEKLIDRLRVHVESRHDIPERALAAEVGKGNPMKFMVEKLPILNETHVQRASLLDEPGGFQVQIQFNTLGAKILESYTSAAAGRHLLIMTEIDDEGRWIAAPLIRRRLGDGTLSFVPAASREDMDRLVRGLNKMVEKNRKQWLE